MKNSIRFVFILLFFISSCTPKDVMTKEEALSALHSFDKGWKEKNKSTVDSILSPSYIYFTQSGGIFSRNNVVATAGSPDYKLDTVRREEFDIRIEGNTAVINSIWEAKGVYVGNPFNDRQRCSVTLIKNKGKVTILSEHCTLINKF